MMEQNRLASQNRRSLTASACLLLAAVALCVVAAVACAMLSAALMPGKAFANSDYAVSRVDISAQVETDGSLQVVERRTLTLAESTAEVQWVFDEIPGDAELQVNSVRKVLVDSQGNATGQAVVLEAVPFVLQWRDGGGPDNEVYSVDRTRDAMYVFLEASGATQQVIEVDYTIKNGVSAYSDIGEVYWRFVGGRWSVDSENVSLTIALPIPSGVVVEPDQNVLAWAHAPEGGTVEINEDGSVSYAVPHVDAGKFADARVVFPVEWLSNLPATERPTSQTDLRLQSVIEDEQTWTDTSNWWDLRYWRMVLICTLTCAVALAVGLLAYLRFGREHKPQFKDDYWRAVPDLSLHPAVIGRLWRWNHVNAKDLVATLLHLDAEGVLRISVEAPSLSGTSSAYVSKAALARMQEVRIDLPQESLALLPSEDGGGVSDPDGTEEPGAASVCELDAKALELLAAMANAQEGGAVAESAGVSNAAATTGDAESTESAGGAEGALVVTARGIRAFAKTHPQECLDLLDGWHGLLTTEADKHQFFEPQGAKWQRRICVLGVALGVLGILAGLNQNSWIPVLCALPSAACLVVLGNHTARRSVEANELAARCKALRNWLRDCKALGEQLPADERERKELLVYAHLFKVADKAPGATPAGTILQKAFKEAESTARNQLLSE